MPDQCESTNKGRGGHNVLRFVERNENYTTKKVSDSHLCVKCVAATKHLSFIKGS